MRYQGHETHNIVTAFGCFVSTHHSAVLDGDFKTAAQVVVQNVKHFKFVTETDKSTVTSGINGAADTEEQESEGDELQITKKKKMKKGKTSMARRGNAFRLRCDGCENCTSARCSHLGGYCSK